MHTPRKSHQGMPLGRAALWLALAIWTISLLRTPLPALGGSFIHLINLVFHEAGHILFAPFGSFMMSLAAASPVIVPCVHRCAR